MKSGRKTTCFSLTADRSSGFAFLVTLIVLVVLASLAAGLSVRLTMAKRRQQYMVDYQRARYGADSAMKYILSVLPAKNFPLQNRKDKPDFSDLYWMDQQEYGRFIADWAADATDEQIQAVLKPGASLRPAEQSNPKDLIAQLLALFGAEEKLNETEQSNRIDANIPDSTISSAAMEGFEVVELDPNDVQVPGPYGPPWPYVIEPIELEMGPCRITIVIEDENAKMPLSWLVTSSAQANKRAENALKTFCEWMAWDKQSLARLQNIIETAMKEVAKKKMFTLNPSPILLRPVSQTPQTPAATPQTQRATTRMTTSPAAAQAAAQPAAQTRPPSAHATDFAKLFHSSLLDLEALAEPLPNTGQRQESPLKYLSLWGAQRVNINTAPRHVLEAAFTLAIDPLTASQLAQSVIVQRREKPFRTAAELRELGRLDSETMTVLQNYITTTSTFFQVRVISRSGNARAAAVATVIKEGRQIERLAVMYE